MKAVKRTRKAQAAKTNYMRDDAFADLNEALEDAHAFEREERRDLNVTRIQSSRSPKAISPKDIARLKTKPNRA